MSVARLRHSCLRWRDKLLHEVFDYEASKHEETRYTLRADVPGGLGRACVAARFHDPGFARLSQPLTVHVPYEKAPCLSRVSPPGTAPILVATWNSCHSRSLMDPRTDENLELAFH